MGCHRPQPAFLSHRWGHFLGISAVGSPIAKGVFGEGWGGSCNWLVLSPSAPTTIPVGPPPPRIFVLFPFQDFPAAEWFEWYGIPTAVRARFQGCLLPGRAPSSRLRAPLGKPGALGGSQLNPALKEGRGWDRHSLPTWPGGGSLASVVPVAEGLGHGQQSGRHLGSPLPRALGTAALVRRPGQAEAEKPGSVEKSQPGEQSPTIPSWGGLALDLRLGAWPPGPGLSSLCP